MALFDALRVQSADPNSLISTRSTRTCSQTPNFPYTDIVIEGYQYRRYQTGAQPFWTPTRFPGQYFDAETDLFENWNRYYDASVGRYLQSEPRLQTPRFIVRNALLGHDSPVYAYALNNPLHFIDPSGG